MNDPDLGKRLEEEARLAAIDILAGAPPNRLAIVVLIEGDDLGMHILSRKARRHPNLIATLKKAVAMIEGN